MEFNPNNPIFAQLFESIYEEDVAKRERKRDTIRFAAPTKNPLIQQFPPFSMFHASIELFREKYTIDQYENLKSLPKNEGPDTINIIRLSQIHDVLQAVKKECEEQKSKACSSNAMLTGFLSRK